MQSQRLKFDRLRVDDERIKVIDKDIDSVVVVTSSLGAFRARSKFHFDVIRHRVYPSEQKKTIAVLDPSNVLSWFQFPLGTQTFVLLGMTKRSTTKESFVNQVLRSAAASATSNKSKTGQGNAADFAYGDNRATPAIYAQE